MYYIYVLFLKNKELYKGYTDNLERRMKEHNSGLVQATKYKRPLELIYHEAYHNKKDAIDRERYFKTGWGRNYLRKVLKNYIEENKNPKI